MRSSSDSFTLSDSSDSGWRQLDNGTYVRVSSTSSGSSSSSWSRAMSLRQGWARGFGRIQVRSGSGLLMEQKSTQLRQLSKIVQVGSNNQTEHLCGNTAHGPPGLQARREVASKTKDGDQLVGQPGAARIMNNTLQSAAT